MPSYPIRPPSGVVRGEHVLRLDHKKVILIASRESYCSFLNFAGEAFERTKHNESSGAHA